VVAGLGVRPDFDAHTAVGAAPGRAAAWPLPRVLVADDGAPIAAVDGLPTGAFLRDLDVAMLVARAAALDVPWAVDLDTVRGLHPDAAAGRFVVEQLGGRAVVSRRAAAVRAAAAAGAVGLLAFHAFDSTGLRRIAAIGALPPGIGAFLSPGLVLPHLRPDELALLPRPLVGHGLIVRPTDAIACLDLADAIVVRRDAARFLMTSLRHRSRPSATPLTTIPIEE
jgi:glycerol-3-phosphate responsive antiterminator